MARVTSNSKIAIIVGLCILNFICSCQTEPRTILPKGCVTMLLRQCDSVAKIDRKYYNINIVTDGYAEKKQAVFRGYIIPLIYNAKLKQYTIPISFNVVKIPFEGVKISKNSLSKVYKIYGGSCYYRVAKPSKDNSLIFIFKPDSEIDSYCWVYPSLINGIDFSKLPIKKDASEGYVYKLNFPGINTMQKVCSKKIDKTIQEAGGVVGQEVEGSEKVEK